MSRSFRITIGVLVFSLMLCACASTPSNEHEIRKLVPTNMRVRRPIAKAADPNSTPGARDYRSDPLPNEKFDCEKVEWLFRELNLEEIQGCLRTMLKSRQYQAEYRLKREPVPYMELEATEATPPCLKEFLPTIPVPREILFQSTTSGGSTDSAELRCYAAGLDVEADRVMDIRLPRSKMTLEVSLPLTPPPQSSDETLRLLASWALTPLWEDEDTRFLRAKIVPDHLCRACLGERNILKDEPVPVTWP